jgi:hypothetical protein
MAAATTLVALAISGMCLVISVGSILYGHRIIECKPMSGFKQVLVVRNDLNIRKGKMVAQGAHASIMFLVHRLCDPNAGAKDQMIHRASQTLVSSSDPSKGGADDGLSIRAIQNIPFTTVKGMAAARETSFCRMRNYCPSR